MSRLSRSTYLDNFAAAFRSRALGNLMFGWVNRFVLPPSELFRVFTDFEAAPGGSLPGWLTTQDTSAAGAPTLAFDTDAAGGVWSMKLAADNEVEAITLYGGDNLIFDIAKDPILRFRAKINPDVTGASGNFDAGTILVMGLASNRNATLNSVVTNAWFRMEGANKNILIESDDGTTDNDDDDTTIDWVADTWLLFEIDCTNHADVRFKINGVDRTPAGTSYVIPSTGNLQFFAELQKGAVANMDHKVSFDFIDVDAAR